jgi:hypothetical protein
LKAGLKFGFQYSVVQHLSADVIKTAKFERRKKEMWRLEETQPMG